MRIHSSCWLASLLFAISASAQTPTANSADPYLQKFPAMMSPAPLRGLLQKGDRLAICGDSITEQKMYSRIMETYLTVCVPEMDITVRQYGWSGEKAAGFLGRMTNDCLRFKPTVATTSYGMNDHEYRAYEPRIGELYREKMSGVVESFKANGVRVLLGTAGTVGKKPSWVGDPNASIGDMNLNLANLRNIDIEIAGKAGVGFADVFWPMLTIGHSMAVKSDGAFALSGKDGVHPGWAGQVVMAYAFLHGFGLDGAIGTFTMDLVSGTASVTPGHEVISSSKGEVEIKSSRYPFCPGEGDPAKDDNIRAGTLLVPFAAELNRLTLLVKHADAPLYTVTWGEQKKIFSGGQLRRGINLAEEFLTNPFSDAFKKVDAAVFAKQQFETHQIKEVFHGGEGKADMEAAAAKTEAERAPLAAAIKAAFVPVTHHLKITAE